MNHQGTKGTKFKHQRNQRPLGFPLVPLVSWWSIPRVLEGAMLPTKLVLAMAVLLFSGAEAWAQNVPPRLIPFQARLTDAAGATVPDGVYGLTFNIYETETGCGSCWSETHGTVSVVGGVVNVILGAMSSLEDINFNPTAGTGCDPENPSPGTSCDCLGIGQRYLGITVGQGPEEMVPRHQLVPAFHARTADIAAGVLPGGITGDMLAEAAVTSFNIASGSVVAGDLSTVPGQRITGVHIEPASLDVTHLSSEAGKRITGEVVEDDAIGLRHLQTAEQVLLPAGVIVAWASNGTPPERWLLCDGRTVSRTANPDLYAAIGTAHGAGDGVTTVNLPDYRGRFLRGANNAVSPELDPGPRSAMASGGAADGVGSVQDDLFKSHTHSATGTGYGYLEWLQSGSEVGLPTGSWKMRWRSSTGDPSSGAGAETRPKNAAVNWIIKCGPRDSCTAAP